MNYRFMSELGNKDKSELYLMGNERMRIALFCLASALCLCAPAVPRVEVPPQGVAFGEITAGVEAKGSLVLSNTEVKSARHQ